MRGDPEQINRLAERSWFRATNKAEVLPTSAPPRWTTVFNLATGEYGTTYSLAPRQAVIAAHAHLMNDWHTWDYEDRYGPQVVTGDDFVTCGDFTARTH